MRALAYIRRHPFSVALSVVVLALGLALETLWGAQLAALSASPQSIGEERRWWTPLTALLLPDSVVQLLFALLLALTMLAYAERLMGSWRTAALFLGTGVLGIVLGAGVQALAASWGEVWARAGSSDLVSDPVIGICGAVMAASAFAPALYRRRIRLIGFSWLVMFTLYAGDSDSLYRLIAALLGLFTGLILARRATHPAWHRSSYRETRTLVAAIVAVTGLGPLIVLLTGVGTGPLSPIIAGLRGADISTVISRCARAATERCVVDVPAIVAAGAGSFLMSIVPLVLCLVAAWGLRAGRRAAWFLALGVNVTMAVLTALSLVIRTAKHPESLAAFDKQFPGFAVFAIAVPLAVMLLLVITRRRFAVRANRVVVRRFALVVLAAFVGLLLVDTILVLTLTNSSGFWNVLGDAVRRFLPTGIGRPRATTPLVGLPRAIHRGMGAAFWGVFAVAMLGLLRARANTATDDALRYRDRLRRYGSGTLGFMGTWPGNSHWFSPDGSGVIAYRVVSDIAIAVGDPVCAPEDMRATVRGFIDFCDSNAWTPVFYSTHEEVMPVFRDLGWKQLSVAEETVVPLERFALTGKVWTKVRQPYNRGNRDGLTAVWTRWVDLGPAMTAKLDALSEQWVSEKALPEMRFTLGGLEELKDPDVALMLAIGPDGELQAVTSWLPCWEDGELVGWTLDFMRRADDAMSGVMEYLLASAALRMKEEGLATMSLSGAPLAQAPDESGDPDGLTQLLAWLSRVLEPAYGFASLFRFKGKFNPDYRPLYLTYADPAQLPTIGLALARAYLPDVSPREYLALMRTLSG
ncbi:lysylphosphatidylglycerol synthetase-like protein (DUF2156 family) [Microbacterium resistens]|uniref:Lysylphosphatidylglycerol synthetase-like protein (DUF2156 family) n=1 Tax=Microbacterium resistens TaxID=156977 RepID=A0ABU1SC94_9MICO|nr:DUF2156 domain-containing protein [Microbacterium resistens]MDR6867225.1 lysylphosphatidylglycerol synthetase-like protein (DUF2156 family) [Microbacterium resistens]